jgi:carbon storage regulator
MLVLSRKKNESIVINNDITIVVVEIRGDKVRLGVEAPKEVPVHRQEVYEAIHSSQRRWVEVGLERVEWLGGERLGIRKRLIRRLESSPFHFTRLSLA